MLLLLVYLVLIVGGNMLAYFIGIVVEHPQIVGFAADKPATSLSLAFFLAAYFLNLWIAWIIAVRITAPRRPAAPVTMA
jgi:hypothetical protein